MGEIVSKGKHYIDNYELLEEVLDHQVKLREHYELYGGIENVPKNERHGISFMSSKLAHMCYELTYNLTNKHNYRHQPYREDMVMDVTLTLMKAVKSFNIDYFVENNTKPNPYGYMTRICDRACAKYCDKENKRYSQHLDYILEEGGLDFIGADTDDKDLYNQSMAYFRQIRNDFKGKWSKEAMREREQDKS